MSRPAKELKAYWDQKLKDSGLEDIEEEDARGERILKRSAPNPLAINPEVIKEAKIDFYRAISRKCTLQQFSNELEEQIMLAYSEGISQAEIKRRMENLGIKMHRETLYEIIYQYLGKWGLKPYYKKWAKKKR